MPENSLFYHLSVPYANVIPSSQTDPQEATGVDKFTVLSEEAAQRILEGQSPLLLW